MNVWHLSPSRCMLCGCNVCYDELPVCADCAHSFFSMLRSVCRTCGKTVFECDCPNGRGGGFVFFYGAPQTKHIIYMLKNAPDERDIAFLAEMLVLSQGITEDRFDAVTYVPRRGRAVRFHGFDQAYALASAVSDISGVPLLCLLEHSGKKQQKLLSSSERVKNMKDSYCLKYIPSERFKKLLLVDDVITTGATLKACASLLRESTARAVVPVAVTKTNFDLAKQLDYGLWSGG